MVGVASGLAIAGLSLRHLPNSSQARSTGVKGGLGNTNVAAASHAG